MIVAIGERLFEPTEEKILIILSPVDIDNIKMMAKHGNNTYTVYPQGIDKGELVSWMERKIKEAEAKHPVKFQ